MDQQVYHSGKKIELVILNLLTDDQIPIINNEERLFVGSKIKAERTDNQGTITFDFDGQTITLKPGESKSVLKTKAGNESVTSKILITNFGLWNTSNMKYVQ